MIEQTIVFIDTASLQRSITGKIIDLLMRTDLELIGAKMFVPSLDFINQFCKIKRNKLSRDYVKAKYFGKRVMVLVLQGENAIKKVKIITGKARKKAEWHGRSIRGIFFGGVTRQGIKKLYENVVQIAANREEAVKLIKLVWQKRNNCNKISVLPGYEPKTYEERTLVMLKPEALHYKLAGKIIDDLSRSGLYIVGARIARPTREQVEKLYAQHKDKPFYKELVEHLTQDNSKIMLLVYQGRKGEVVRVIREIIGNKNPKEAAIGTIRSAYGKDTTANVIHASSGVEETEREIAIFDDENTLLEPIIEYY